MSAMDDELVLMPKVSEPVLWHTDLHIGNIYVSHENPPNIVSIIDWQSVVVSPLFVQARFPEFLSVGEDFALGTTELPQLPQSFDEMDAQDQKYAEHKFLQAKLAKVYELSSGVENTRAYKALWIPLYVRELFTRGGEVSEEGEIRLRACLVEMYKVWRDLGFTAPCPIHFSEDDLQRHEQQFDTHRNFHAVHDFAQKILGSDFEGWIAPEFDFEAKKRENEDLMQQFMDKSTMFNMEPDDIFRIWPFRERP